MKRIGEQRKTIGGELLLVPTPIGNLSDISTRAIEALKSADVIACEDTRTSGRLLSHFEIDRPKIAYHEFNERAQSGRLIDRMAQGETIAVISDAGTPGIADPAYRIVRDAIDAGVRVTAIPGPCAAIVALTASGLPTDRFFFEGFLPHKSGARQRRFEAVKHLAHTLVFYESPHRIQKSVKQALEVLGDRSACIARELTKLHEEYIRGTLSEIIASISNRTLKGEIVLLIAGNKDAAGTETDENELQEDSGVETESDER